MLVGDAQRHEPRRREVFGKIFGPPSSTLPPEAGAGSTVAVHVFPPGVHGRDFHTLVTSGLSDRPRPAPSPAPGQPPRGAGRRVELVLYVAEPRSLHLALLRRLAALQDEAGAALVAGDVIPNGAPPAPLFEDSELDTVFLCPSVLDPDASLGRHLELDGEPVDLAWVVPITSAEADLAAREGIEVLLQLFDETEFPHVLEERRASRA